MRLFVHTNQGSDFSISEGCRVVTLVANLEMRKRVVKCGEFFYLMNVPNTSPDLPNKSDSVSNAHDFPKKNKITPNDFVSCKLPFKKIGSNWFQNSHQQEKKQNDTPSAGKWVR